MVLIDNQSDQKYEFKLNEHVLLNKESDSWRELPVFKEDANDMLPG